MVYERRYSKIFEPIRNKKILTKKIGSVEDPEGALVQCRDLDGAIIRVIDIHNIIISKTDTRVIHSYIHMYMDSSGISIIISEK